MFLQYVDAWCHIDETLGWIIEVLCFFFLFASKSDDILKQVKKYSVQGSEGGNKETEDRKVNKSKDEDFCWPLWVHSPVGTQADGMRKKALLPDDSNPIPSCVTWLSEGGLLPFFPQHKAFAQCANHTTVHGLPGKSSKGVG